MNIKSIGVQNFRLLKNFSVMLEDSLSLVIGKNNCGKTSFLAILERFLNKEDFEFDDFSLEFQGALFNFDLDTYITLKEFEANPLALSLRIEIEYSEVDDTKNIFALMQDVEEELNKVIIKFEYQLKYEKYLNLIADFKEYAVKDPNRPFKYYLRKNYKSYFERIIKSVHPIDDTKFSLIDHAAVNRVLNFQVIHASRNVTNINDGSSKVLSHLSSKYYQAKI